MLTPDLQTLIRTDILQFLIPGHQLQMLTGCNHLIDSLYLVNKGSSKFLMAIETLDNKATHGGSVHLISDLAEHVMDMIVELKGVPDIKIDLHHVLGALHPARSMDAKIETGTEETIVLRVLSDMTRIKDRKVGIGGMLDNERPALTINYLGGTAEDSLVKDITVTYLMGQAILL